MVACGVPSQVEHDAAGGRERVERTRRGVMAGRDEVLEAGLRVAEGLGGVP